MIDPETDINDQINERVTNESISSFNSKNSASSPHAINSIELNQINDLVQVAHGLELLSMQDARNIVNPDQDDEMQIASVSDRDTVRNLNQNNEGHDSKQETMRTFYEK